MGIRYEGKRPVQTGLTKNYSVAAASTGTPMVAGNIYSVASTVSSTGATPKNYTLAAPTAKQVGLQVEIHCVQATTIKAPRVTLTSASLYSTVSSTGVTKDTLRFPRADASCILRAWSTSKWRMIANTNVTVTTS